MARADVPDPTVSSQAAGDDPTAVRTVGDVVDVPGVARRLSASSPVGASQSTDGAVGARRGHLLAVGAESHGEHAASVSKAMAQRQLTRTHVPEFQAAAARVEEAVTSRRPSGLKARLRRCRAALVRRTRAGSLASRGGQSVVVFQRATVPRPRPAFDPTAIIVPEGATATAPDAPPRPASRSRGR